MKSIINKIDFSGVSTAQLKEIRNILTVGVTAAAEAQDDAGEHTGEGNMDDKERIAGLEKQVAELLVEKETWNTAKSESEISALKEEKEAWLVEKTDLETKASQVTELTTELGTQKEELETLRKFKADTEEAAERAEKITGITDKLKAAGLESDIEAEADYWLSMTDDTLTKTITKMSDLLKGASASAAIKVPPVGGEDETSPAKVVSEGLSERKQAKDK